MYPRERIIEYARLYGDHDLASPHCDFGVTIGWRGFFYFNIPTLLILPVIILFAGLPAALGYVPVLLIAPALSRWIHPYLHHPHQSSGEPMPTVVMCLLNLPYFRVVRRHHWLHHNYQNCNFNLLLGGDWLLGVHRSPSREDLIEMVSLGIR